jgi:signal transduction histidine kinase
MMVPKRDSVLLISEDLQALNRQAFVQQQQRVAEVYGLTQLRILETLGFSTLVGLIIAVVAAVYAGRLESRLRRQRAAEAQTARDLQKLSARLINAQEDERRNIARELHDEVGQVLTAIKVELSVAQRELEASGVAPHILESARTITDGAVQCVRDLSHLLHPAILDDLGLLEAVDCYVRGFAGRHGIRVELTHVRMDERMARQIETSVYRIVQEALTNVAKHAKARACHVDLCRLPESLVVTVNDDGIGFDTAAAGRTGSERGLGLVNIRERAAELLGTVTIESVAGQGTRLVVEVPVPPVALTEPSEIPSDNLARSVSR